MVLQQFYWKLPAISGEAGYIGRNLGDESMLERFAIAFASDPSFESIQTALRLVAIKHPDLDKAAKTAAISRNPQKIERAFETAVGILIAEAQAGTIKMSGATLIALRAVRFDHMHATYTIGGTTFPALTLITANSETVPG